MLPPANRRRRIAIFLTLAAVAVGVTVGGCSFQAKADKDRGRQLFVQKCGTCHALAQAGTAATIGPDLDAAFAEARANGQDSGTFTGVVRAQIENPRPSTKNPAVSMPGELVKGQDLEDVAAYVGSVAGVPGIKPPAQTPQQFFASTCGSCHALKAAGTSGTVGPDLDKVLPGQSPDEIMQSIIDPGAKATPGYPSGVMPTTFGTLPKAQLKALIDFLVKATGG